MNGRIITGHTTTDSSGDADGVAFKAVDYQVDLPTGLVQEVLMY